MARFLAISLALVIAVFALASTRDARAQGWHGALAGMHAAGSASANVGEFCWLEEHGIAIRLTAAPAVQGRGHYLIAGEVAPERVSAGLYALVRDAATLRESLASKGAAFGAETPFNFQDRGDHNYAGTSVPFAVASGAPGLLSTFEIEGRRYALVLTAPNATFDLPSRRQELLGDMFVLRGMAGGTLAPLVGEGRFTCRLADYYRDAGNFARRAGNATLLMRMFLVARTNYATFDAVQNDLEDRLKRQDVRRTGGSRVNVMQTPGFLGEYFHAQSGDLLRILYADLGKDFLVAVLSGPDTARDVLRAEGEALAASIAPLPLPRTEAAHLLAQAHAARLVAWQDGGTLYWGVYFDDAQGKPALWREDGQRYEIQLKIEGAPANDARSGVAHSSRDLNPLVEPERRAFRVPPDSKAPVTLSFVMGELRASLKLDLQP